MIGDKFEVKDLRIEKLTAAHREKIEILDTYEEELKNFLIEDALDNQEKKISATYLWFNRATNELVAYITLLTDKINLDSVLKEEFKKQGIRYHELPSLKIGRLCVDNKFLKKGIGRILIKFAIVKAGEINELAGCRFLTLDAKRNADPNKDAMHFYKKLGFTPLITNNKSKRNENHLYKDITKIVEESA